MNNLGITYEEVARAIDGRYKNTRPQRIRKAYVLELLDNLDGNISLKKEDLDDYRTFKKLMLNGADDWVHYSFGCCSLYCNYDIVERLELKQDCRKYNGESLLERQAYELKVACHDLYTILSEMMIEAQA